MSLTAIQLREQPRCELVAGDAHAMLESRRGAVALFAPGAVVAYAVRVTRPRVFVFRTSPAPGRATKLPGVFPDVHLLLALESARVVRRCKRFFALLARQKLDPSHLPDDFYLRLDRLLRGRSPLVTAARPLLPGGSSHTCPEVPRYRCPQVQT